MAQHVNLLELLLGRPMAAASPVTPPRDILPTVVSPCPDGCYWVALQLDTCEPPMRVAVPTGVDTLEGMMRAARQQEPIHNRAVDHTVDSFLVA